MWTYRARLDDRPGHRDDGDTVHLIIDVGFDVNVRKPIRLKDVHAPERTQPGGRETTAYRTALMIAMQNRATQDGRFWPFRVVTDVNRNPEPDEIMSFVRYVATVYDDGTGDNINDKLNMFLEQHPEWGSGE